MRTGRSHLGLGVLSTSYAGEERVQGKQEVWLAEIITNPSRLKGEVVRIKRFVEGESPCGTEAFPFRITIEFF